MKTITLLVQDDLQNNTVMTMHVPEGQEESVLQWFASSPEALSRRMTLQVGNEKPVFSYEIERIKEEEAELVVQESDQISPAE